MHDRFERSVALDAYTTLRVGGPAQYFLEATTRADLEDALVSAKKENLPVTILGGGSNVLISDRGVSGLVIRMVIKGISVVEEGSSVLLTASAGELLDDVVAYATSHGLWGIENLSHIPGTIGATPVQNVGAYGVEIGDVLVSVEAIDTHTGAVRIFTREECQFGYRDSIFKHSKGAGYCITAVTIRLSKEARPIVTYADLACRDLAQVTDPEIIRNAVIAIRSAKFPDWRAVGTAGSFFKNPIISTTQYVELSTQYPGLPGHPVGEDKVKIPLGWILDRVCQLRGYREGNVGTFAGQALVLVNYADDNAKEVQAFASMVIARVQAMTGITVECEVRTLGS